VIRTWCPILAAAVAVVACAGTPAVAQTPATAFVGQRVVEVDLVAEGRPIDNPMIMGLVETHVGDPLSMANVRESITHIFGLGRYQDVQVEATSAPGGMTPRTSLRRPLTSIASVFGRRCNKH